MIITNAMSKGGCGKTTIAQLLLGSLAESGAKVAALDADLNRSLTNWVESVSDYPITIRHEIDETNIVGVAEELEGSHDLVVIDTAGAASQATVFAIGCADLVIVPMQASSSDIVEAIKTVKLVESAAKMSRREIPCRLLFTHYQPKTNVTSHTEAEVVRYGLPMFESKLNRLVAFREMTFTGRVPLSGRAGEQVRALLDEVKTLGVLPFYRNVA